MVYTPTPKPANPSPVALAAHSAVLLVFFMPPALTNQSERALLLTLANQLQVQLNGLVRVLRIDGNNHSDVIRSFAITHTPAFVLVRGGVELWRQESLSEAVSIVSIIKDLLSS
jgi:hypothetical protein